ncbi:unnamed protein product [Clonostachys chloroleuca]|uniref:Uncharacterized protein n=1 Tax=Clonostachys chloroleuca TaxID=1926264 RepID=A0AA35QB19_9HYPO|nr:unnamed protein product [Clonostachys chloroleuca]
MESPTSTRTRDLTRLSYDEDSFQPSPPSFRFQAWNICKEFGWESLQENRQMARFIEQHISVRFKAFFTVSPVMPINTSPALAIPRSIRITLTHATGHDWEKDVQTLAKIELPKIVKKYFRAKLNIKLDFYNAYAEGEDFENVQLGRALASRSLQQRLRGFLQRVKQKASDDIPPALQDGKQGTRRVILRTDGSRYDPERVNSKRLSFSSFASSSLSFRKKEKHGNESNVGSPRSIEKMPMPPSTPIPPSTPTPRFDLTKEADDGSIFIENRPRTTETLPRPVKTPTRTNTGQTIRYAVKDGVSNLVRALASGSFMASVILPASPCALLFYQLPDNIIQLAMLSRARGEDSKMSVSLFGSSPIARATRRTPLQAHMKNGNLSLFFQKTASRNGQPPVLAQCNLIPKGSEQISWDVNNLEFPDAVKLHPRAEYFPSNILLLESEVRPGDLIAARADKDNGGWLMTRPPESMPANPEAHYFTTTCFQPDSFRIRSLAKNGIVQCQVEGLRTWGALNRADMSPGSHEMQRKDIEWHGKPPSSMPVSCRLVEGHGTAGIIAVLSRSADDGIYLFRGHPWWDELEAPELVCRAKRGSHFIYLKDWRQVVFLSPQNQLSWVPLDVEDDNTILVGNTALITNGDPLAMLLNAGLHPT